MIELNAEWGLQPFPQRERFIFTRLSSLAASSPLTLEIRLATRVTGSGRICRTTEKRHTVYRTHQMSRHYNNLEKLSIQNVMSHEYLAKISQT